MGKFSAVLSRDRDEEEDDNSLDYADLLVKTDEDDLRKEDELTDDGDYDDDDDDDADKNVNEEKQKYNNDEGREVERKEKEEHEEEEPFPVFYDVPPRHNLETYMTPRPVYLDANLSTS